MNMKHKQYQFNLTMRSLTKWFAAFALLLVVAGEALAQPFPVTLSVIPVPPYSPRLSDWRSRSDALLVTLTNSGTTELRIRLRGFIDNHAGIRVETKDDYRGISPIILPAGASRTITSRETGLFDAAGLRFSGTDASTIERSGQLPEGFYDICLQAIDYDNPALSYSDPTALACGSANIAYYEPPRPQTPICETIVETVSPQIVNFMWTQPTSSFGPLTGVIYTLTIAEVEAGQNPNQAFESRRSPEFFTREFRNTTSYLATSDPIFRRGHTYAWRVTARDANTTAPAFIRNNGNSEVCSFTFGRELGAGGTGTLSLNPIYPSNGDVIPWIPPHMVVQFTPYSDNITQMDYTLTVTGGGQSFSSHRVLNWPDGPRRGQGWTSIGDTTRSTYIIVNQEVVGGEVQASSWTDRLQSGVEYTWYVEATFTVNGRTVDVRTPSQTFTLGATRPELQSPADNSTIAPDAQPITLNWRNPRPLALNPPDLVGIRRGSASSFFGISSERWRLELSRDSMFATRDTFGGAIPDYHTGDNAEDLYTSRSQTLSRLDSGKWFWRVSWMQPNGTPYSQSPIWSFRIGAGGSSSGGGGGEDSTHRLADTPGACRDVCSSPAITNRTVSSRTFANGDVIRIGRFNLTLTSVTTSSGSSLSGRGTVQVNFLRAPISVEFSGLRINTDNQVFEGDVNARIATESPISSSVANAMTGALGLTNDQVSSLNTFVSQTTRLVSAFTTTTPVELPIGFNNIIEGEQMVIGIMGMVFHPTNAELNAVMSFQIPEMGPGVGLGLGARQICFHPDGIGGDGKATLYLATDLGYRQPDSWGFVFKAPSGSDSGTYVSWDCNGFRELRLAAQAEFPRSWFLPLPDDGHSLVKASFRTTIRRSGDWIAAASMDRCTIAGANGFGLEVRELAYDHSDVRNPEGQTFPAGYVGEQSTRWKGFYINRAAIILPDELRTFDSSRPLQIAVTNLMIGDGGLTASIRAENVIRFPRGNFGEWGASIDTIAVNFVSSSLQSGGLMGEIKIPVSDSGIYYSAMLSRPVSGSGLAFEFLVQPRDTINCNLWSASLKLNPTSRIQLGNSTGTFRASATLSGDFSLFGNVGGVSGLSFRGIHFENFQVSSVSPYINQGTWSFASENHGMSGFPLSISNIGLVTGDRGGSPGAGIQFTVSLNLQSGSNAISGGTTLSVWGKLASGSGPMHFEFDGLQLDSVGVAADMGAVQISGGLALYRTDPVFGDGFRGAINASFLRQVTVTATVQFGSVRTTRYWYVDAKAVFTPGIPVFSGFGIYGFGGGAWYHMRREGEISATSAPGAGVVNRDTTPGRTSSGYRFIPDAGTEFGLRAMVVIGTQPTPDAFNGDVAFEAEFLSGGGLGRISILGNAYMAAGINSRSDAKVTADLDLTYNFPTSTFHGVFAIHVRANPFIGEGRMVMHADPSTWYIKIGEPTPRTARVYLTLADWFRIDAYIMAGMDLPGPPPLPDEITRILGPLPIVRNPALETGDGFAFGASAELGIPRTTFLIFYAEARIGLGFDISLLNLGSAATCEGMTGPVGIDGWYAQGQLYAYIAASIGLHVDVFFTEGDFEILGIQAAAAIRAGAPNPTWAVAAVGGHYSILGGLVEGDCHFEFQLGEQCIPVTDNPLGRINLIAGLEPRDGAGNVEVFTEPQATFNVPIDRNFEIRDFGGDGSERVRTFRVRVRRFTLQQASNSANVPGSYHLTPDGFDAIYSPLDALNGNTQYRANVAVYGEEWRGGWVTATRLDGTTIEENKTSTFTTGAAPNNIPQSNIAFTHPFDRQRFFLQRECPEGTVQLKVGQPYLFTPREGRRITTYARFIPTMGGDTLETTATYNASARAVIFPLPTMVNSTSYALQIVNKDEDAGTLRRSGTELFAIDGRADIRTDRSSYFKPLRLVYNRRGNTANIRERELPGATVRKGENLLYHYYFKTSQFNTLREKIESYTAEVQPASPRLGNFEIIKTKLTGPELMDVYDMQGLTYLRSGVEYRIPPLIDPSAPTRNNEWHQRFTNPWIYDVINQIRRYREWGYQVEFERYMTGRQGLHLAQYDSRPQRLLSDDEMLPPIARVNIGVRSSGLDALGSGLLGTGTGFPMAGSLFVTPGIKINYLHGIPVPFDFMHLQSAAARMRSFYGPEFLGDQLYNKLGQVVAKRYELMYRGTYSLRFTYPMCQDPDRPVSIPKDFQY